MAQSQTNYFKNNFRQAIIYSRVSTKLQNEDNSSSLLTQNTQMKQFLIKNKMNINNIYEFYDVGSGYKKFEKLQNLNRAVELIKSNKIKTLFLINDISRFSRNIVNAVELLKLFEKNNVVVYSLMDQLWYNNEDYGMHKYHFMEKVISSEKFSFELSQKMKNSVRTRKQRGDVFGRAPYGYESYREGGVRKFRKSNNEINKIKQILEEAHKDGYHNIVNTDRLFRGAPIKLRQLETFNYAFSNNEKKYKILKEYTSRKQMMRNKDTYENDIGIYKVSKLVDKRINNDNIIEYLVRWEGYTEKYDTWEAEKRILDKKLIKEYENNIKLNLDNLSDELNNM
jgi:DNA invertase Pin-like site-specific DNA recombinase